MFVKENTPGRKKVYEQKNAIQKDCTLGNYYISEEKYKTMKSFIAEPGDIIVSCAGTIGEIYILPEEAETGVINQALMRIKLFQREIEKYFILYFDSVLKKEANDKGNGTGMKNIPPFDVLKKMLLPLPPEQETKRILDKIETINSKISIIANSFKSLFDYVQSTKNKILDSIFGQNSSYKSYYGSRTFTTLNKLIPSNKIGDGDWVLSENMDENGEYKIVQLKHIGKGCYINKPYKCINKNFFENNSCSEIKPNFLLINRLVSEEMDACLLPSFSYKTITSVDVCWIAPDEKYDQKYLMYYLLSPAFQSQVLLKSSGSTRKRISKKNLISIPIQIHNLDDQKMIVKDIEQCFELLNSIIQ